MWSAASSLGRIRRPVARWPALVALVLLSHANLRATLAQATDHLPAFEVATIKPARQDNYKPIGLYVYPGGRIFAGQSTLKMLVQYAFAVQHFQVAGGPPWAGEDLYEISAIPPESSKARQLTPKFINDPPSEEQRRMLQSLLIERFGLKFHRAVQEGQVSFLVRTSRPLKLEEAKHKESPPVLAIGGHGYGGMTGQSVSMPFVAFRLSRYLGHPVLDRTGLQGSFDFTLAPSSTDSPEQSANEFLDGISESMTQLGLGLKPGHAPTEMIILDAAARPTEN